MPKIVNRFQVFSIDAEYTHKLEAAYQYKYPAIAEAFRLYRKNSSLYYYVKHRGTVAFGGSAIIAFYGDISLEELLAAGRVGA